MSIQIQNINKYYGTQQALCDITFATSAGDIVGLLGPNGAGKSTLMKILTCSLRPDSGEVHLCGHSIETHPLSIKKIIGYLPESNPLYEGMYVREYLRFIASVRKVKYRAVDQAIEELGLEVEAHKKIGQLSKGYKQRVGLAQAILHKPEILILDEPTTGLDPRQILDIRALIHKLGKERTVILSTHIMQEVEQICTQALIIDRGRVKLHIQDLTKEKQSLEKTFIQYTQ